MKKNKQKVDLPVNPEDHNVLVLGASPKKDRYSNMAIVQLLQKGYQVIPVHPKLAEIEGLTVIPDLASVEQKIHTLTLYIGPQRSAALIDDIIRLNPVRVIINPGTESDQLEEALCHHHINHFHACTLVLLSTNQFSARQ